MRIPLAAPAALRRSTALVLAAVLCAQPAPAGPRPAGCGSPIGSPTGTSDCLFVLQAAIAARSCRPCVCDLDGSGAVGASDALECLRRVVGLSALRRCPPCSATTTTTLPPSADPNCPDRAELRFAAGTGGACRSDDDCSDGRCDTGLGRCTTASDFAWGWTGTSHRDDLHDGSRWSLALDCPGPAPECGVCRVVDMLPAPGNCRCSQDNSIRCNSPGPADPAACSVAVACQADADCRVCRSAPTIACRSDGDCPAGDHCMVGLTGASCIEGRCTGACACYTDPPLPLSSGGFPQCLLQQLRAPLQGTVDVDRGSWDLALAVLERRYLGERVGAPCPYCGGRCSAPVSGLCLEPAVRAGQPCSSDSDCSSDTGAGLCRITLAEPCGFDSDCDLERGDGSGRCDGFDPVAGDGKREGTCVLGGDHGRPCDVDSVHGAFPAPSGGGYSYDCFPNEGKAIAALGIPSMRRLATEAAALPARIPCGLPSAPQTCPCGTCTNDRSRACSDSAQCEEGGACNNPGASTLPNLCTDGVCTPQIDGLGLCLSDPPLRFCDGIVRPDGEPVLSCGSDADCNATSCGPNSCGRCTIQRSRSCFPDPVDVPGLAHPDRPRLASLACTAEGFSGLVSSVVGLPGPLREVRQARVTFRCPGRAGVVYEGSGSQRSCSLPPAP